MCLAEEQSGAAKRIEHPVFVPCADNYRYAALQRTTEEQILKAILHPNTEMHWFHNPPSVLKRQEKPQTMIAHTSRKNTEHAFS